MKEKRKNTRWDSRKWGIRIVLLLLISGASFYLFLVLLLNAMANVEVWFEDPRSDELEGQEAHDFIEGRLFPLPENAHDVYLYYSSMQYFEVYIRFNARPEVFASWFDSLDLCFDRLIGMRQIYHNGEILSWWTPTIDFPNTEPESCRVVPYRHISVDKQNAESWIIYIFITDF